MTDDETDTGSHQQPRQSPWVSAIGRGHTAAGDGWFRESSCL